MTTINRRLFIAISLVTSTQLVGCSSEPSLDRKPVFGSISGAEGRIGTATFRPANGLKAPAATVSIRNGQYKFNETNGPLPGNYTVLVALDGGGSSTAWPDDLERGSSEKVAKRGTATRAPSGFQPKMDEFECEATVPSAEPWQVNLKPKSD